MNISKDHPLNSFLNNGLLLKWGSICLSLEQVKDQVKNLVEIGDIVPGRYIMVCDHYRNSFRYRNRGLEANDFLVKEVKSEYFVGNNLGRNDLGQLMSGDLCFFYHEGAARLYGLDYFLVRVSDYDGPLE